ncbi:EthD family reductase [Hyphomicrobium sp.]|uniref:EthD family reductase n=1 Tax=Hyphomicrobium sp. TaxID=82 RepID=UPI002D772DA0|nr:EthD family reductase [Hyphomicrobium sp.]HET6389342.1 EthD family reductase [Hyphomicrobium sp.]
MTEPSARKRNAAATVYVTYAGTPDSRFDRRYYVEQHLPLVLKAWQRYGLQSVAAFFPALPQAGTIAICECEFRDEAAVEAAFNSPETPEVMADVANFTDIAPTRLRAMAL